MDPKLLLYLKDELGTCQSNKLHLVQCAAGNPRGIELSSATTRDDNP